MAAQDDSLEKPGTDQTQLERPSVSSSGGATVLGTSPHSIQPELESMGPYRLIRILGEGGMGQVWLAEQTAPVKRQVALKLMKGGWYDDEVIQRFQSECQTLAVMDHPAIAKIFDAGSSQEGRPWFVMEYVAGVPITTYCDQHEMNTRQRLELFILVCDGVQHAHQKSIIHRDLKPSNILISEVNGVPLPRIIDFGIAKAALQKGGDEDQTALTRMGELIGTPDYMSPEQSDPTVADIDTRTDVYSLGVVLYELLTGLLPFASETGQKQRLDEILRQLREVDPPTPSTRLRKDSHALDTQARMRRTMPRQLVSQLRGDLDWITMKALEKDRARRYATPSELAADIRRFLSDEPITARPPSTAYQFARFARRNRVLVGGIAAVMLVLVAGATTSTILAIRATRAQALAQTNFNMARDAVDTYFTDVSESRELRAQNLEGLRHNLLLTARDFYQKFVDTHADDTSLRSSFGAAMQRLGNADLQIGDNAQAERTLTRAMDLLKTSFQQHPRDRLIAENLFSTYASLALLYQNTNQFDKAGQMYWTATQFMDSWRANHKIGAAETNQFADLCDSYGTMLTRAGKLPEAAASYGKALALRKDLVKRFPGNDDYNTGLVMTDLNMVDGLVEANQLKQALSYAQDSVSLGETLYARHPGDPDIMNRLGASYNNLGGLYTLLGRNSAAEAAQRRGMQLRETLAAQHPAIVVYSIHLAGSYINLGELAERDNRPSDALGWLSKAEDILLGVLTREPHQSEARYFLSYDYSWQARAYESQHDRKAALQNWQRAIQYDDHDDPTLRAAKATALEQLGETGAATALADQLAGKNPGADTLFQLAAVYAMADASLAGKNAPLAQAEAAKSFALLGRAAATGYFKVPEQLRQLKTSPQFAAIRNQPGYRSLLSEVSSRK